MTEAKKICFLGFGYDPVNLERLKLDEDSLHRAVFGTARSLKGAGVTEVQKDLRQTMLCPFVMLDGKDNLELLDQYRLLG